MKRMVLSFSLSLAVASTLTSCEDFTQKNIDVATPQQQEINQVDLLLGGSSAINEGEFTLEKLIANTGTFVVEPLVRQLKNDMLGLEKSIQQHCSSLGVFTDLSTEQLQTLRRPVQESWKKAAVTFHKLAAMDFGPADRTKSVILDSLYTFDRQEKCRLDATLFAVSSRGNRSLPGFAQTNNYNVRGLDSLEPLFFADPNKSRCTGRVNPRIAKWFEEPLLKREQVVCSFSQHIVKDMVTKADELAKQWAPSQGHYTATMLRGTVGKPLTVTNNISQTLFSLYSLVREVKLAYPAGLEAKIDGVLTKCPDATCPDKREHTYANFAFDALEASIEGWRMLFLGINPETGTNGNGFDDLLRSRDFDDLAQRMTTYTDTLLENIRTLKAQMTMGETLKNVDPVKCEESTSENRLVEVCALVDDIKKVTDLLKVQYLAALQELSAPAQSRGDND